MFNKPNIIIPFFGDDPWRRQIFKSLFFYYFSVMNNCVLVAPSDGSVPDSRSAARNTLIKNVGDPDDVIVIMDADVWVDSTILNEAISLVDSGEKTWAIPYDSSGYYRLNENKGTETLAKLNRLEFNLPRPKVKDCIIGGFKSYASCIVMKRSFFYECGGYDERFVGWGFEDDAFREVSITLAGQPWRPSKGHLIHVWHPEPNETTWAQPNIEKNVLLYREYERFYNNKVEMSRFLKQLGDQ